jgi:hypothetical protein
MKNSLSLLVVLSLVFLGACVPQASSEKKEVEIRTQGVYDPVTMEVIGGADIGEFLIGDEAKIISVRIRNSNSFPIIHMELILDKVISAGVTFNPNDAGEANYPGSGGTCGPSLGSGLTCEVKLYFNPIRAGDLRQLITFKFQSVLTPSEISTTLSAQAGEAASLIFTNEIQSYGFGVVERRDCQNIRYQDLEIKNVGGLPAKDLALSMTNAPSDDVKAYKIVTHNCPDRLEVGEMCQARVSYQVQNWGDPQDCDGNASLDTAPDGDEYEVFYNGNIKFSYVRDPRGGQGFLNGYFSSLSTTIEGNIKLNGLANVLFDDSLMVVGNTKTKTVKVTNLGYKEAILRAIHVRKAGTTIATCIKDVAGTAMDCRKPADPSDPANRLLLQEFPFRLKDNNQCFDLYSKMDYTRDAEGVLSDPSIKTVSGIPEGGVAGASCLFDLTFHPSVKFLENGDWASPQVEFVMEYDSTWKNLRDDILTIKGEEAIGEPQFFQVTQALYLAAGRLAPKEFRFANVLSFNSNKAITFRSRRFLESSADNGSIKNVIYARLSGDTFAWQGSVLNAGTQFVATNLPAGLSMEMKRVNITVDGVSTEHAEISLAGQASAHSSAATLSNLGIEFLDAAFTAGVAGDIYNSNYEGFGITFFDSYADAHGEDGDPIEHVFFNLGRIALVNSDAYPSRFEYDLKGMVSNPALITSMKDVSTSTDFPVSPGKIDLNTYYKQVSYGSGCQSLSSGGSCKLTLDIVPRAFGNSVTEYGYFMDAPVGFYKTERAKTFEITYTDGATYNDDMTARAPQKMRVSWTGVLVNKGYLVFQSGGDSPGVINYFIAGNEDSFILTMKNDGTGPIPFIRALSSGTTYRNLYNYQDNHPFQYVDCDSGSTNCSGVKDCYEFVKQPTAADPSGAALDCGGADSAQCLAAGESCKMKIKLKIAPPAKLPRGSGGYALASTSAEWGRDFWLDEMGNDFHWPWDYGQGGANRNISFEYIDGDYDGRDDEQFQNFGDKKTIAFSGAPTATNYQYRVQYRDNATMIVESPYPLQSAVIYRQPITLPAIAQGGHLGITSGKSAVTIPEQWIALSQACPGTVVPGARHCASTAHVSSIMTAGDLAAYEYVYHMGTFPANGHSFTGSFAVRNSGVSTAASNVSITYNNVTGGIDCVVPAYSSAAYTGSKTITCTYTPAGSGEEEYGELTISYRNQVKDVSGNFIQITKKVKVVAESSETLTPTLSTQDLDDGGSPFGSSTDYTLKVNAMSPSTPTGTIANYFYIKDIKGGTGIGKRLTFTNPSGSESISDLKIGLKVGVNDSAFDSSGRGMTVKNNYCESAPVSGSLGPSDSCTFDIDYTAPDNESGGPYDRVIWMGYRTVSGQYVETLVNARFEPVNPGILVAKNSSGVNYGTRPGSFIPTPYEIPFGSSPTGTHITVNACSPMEKRTGQIILRNTETEHVSLLRQYRRYKCETEYGGKVFETQDKCFHSSATTTAGTVLHDTAVFRSWYPDTFPATIYNKENRITLTAPSVCFYGPSGGPGDKGFVNADGNVCSINYSWTVTKEMFGKSTVDAENTATVEFYSSNLSRRTSDKINIVYTGFVEPNKISSGVTNLYNIQTTVSGSQGTASFTFATPTPVSGSCGSITKYRIYYCNNNTALNDIFSTSGSCYSSFVERSVSGGSEENITVTGLNAAHYWYFKVAAVRNYNGVDYVSASNINQLGVVVPPLGAFYDPATKRLINDYVLPEGSGGAGTQYYTRATADSACKATKFVIKKNGSNTNITKFLITEAIWNKIISSPDYSSYGAGDPFIYPHWLNDAPRLIDPYFAPDFDCANSNANTPNNMYAYSKQCVDCSCNTLPMLAGSNLMLLPYKYNFVPEGEGFFGMARCYGTAAP